MSIYDYKSSLRALGKLERDPRFKPGVNPPPTPTPTPRMAPTEFPQIDIPQGPIAPPPPPSPTPATIGAAPQAIGAGQMMGAAPVMQKQQSQPPPAPPPDPRSSGDPMEGMGSEEAQAARAQSKAPGEVDPNPKERFSAPPGGVAPDPKDPNYIDAKETGAPTYVDRDGNTRDTRTNEIVDAVTGAQRAGEGFVNKILEGQPTDEEEKARTEAANREYNKQLMDIARATNEHGTGDTLWQAGAEAQSDAERQNLIGQIEHDISTARRQDILNAANLSNVNRGFDKDLAPDTGGNAQSIIEGAFGGGAYINNDGNVIGPDGKEIPESSMNPAQKKALDDARKETGAAPGNPAMEDRQQKAALEDAIYGYTNGSFGWEKGSAQTQNAVNSILDFATKNGRFPTQEEAFNLGIMMIPASGNPPWPFSDELYAKLFGG